MEYTIKIRDFNSLSMNEGREIYSILKNKEIETVKDLHKLSLIEKQSIISIVSRIPFEVVKEINDIDSVFSEVELFPETYNAFQTFKIKNKVFSLIDFDYLTVLEYADLEMLITDSGEDVMFDNLEKIICILFREVKDRGKNIKSVLTNMLSSLIYKNVKPVIINKKEYVSYESKDLVNYELLRKLSFSQTLYALKNYLTYINDLNALYFKREDDLVEEKTFDDEVIEIETKTNTFEKNWGTYHIISSISTSLMEIEEWFKRPLKQFYKHLVYLNAKTTNENQEMMKKSNQYGR